MITVNSKTAGKLRINPAFILFYWPNGDGSTIMFSVKGVDSEYVDETPEQLDALISPPDRVDPTIAPIV